MNLYSTLPALGTGLAAVFGLGMWQYQLIAKRRYEVVEQALTSAGEAAQTLHFIRRSDADDVAAAELRPDGLRPSPWFTAYGRIQGAETQFANFRSSIRSIEMHFGDHSTKSFDGLVKIFDEICQAQASLYFGQASQKPYPTEDHLRDVKNWKEILIQKSADDKITQEINARYLEIKSQFGKYLRPNPFRLFLPFWK